MHYYGAVYRPPSEAYSLMYARLQPQQMCVLQYVQG